MGLHGQPCDICVCVCVYVCVCVCIYTHARAHTHTHTHTHPPIWLPMKAHNCHNLGASLNRPSLCSASHFRPAKPVIWTQNVNYCIFKCQINCSACLDYWLVTEHWRKAQWNMKLYSVIIFLISIYTKVAAWLDMLHRKLKTIYHLIKQLIFIWTVSELT